MNISKKKAIELLKQKIEQFKEILKQPSFDHPLYHKAYYGTESLLEDLFSKNEAMKFRRNVSSLMPSRGIKDVVKHLESCISEIGIYIEKIQNTWPDKKDKRLELKPIKYATDTPETLGLYNIILTLLLGVSMFIAGFVLTSSDISSIDKIIFLVVLAIVFLTVLGIFEFYFHLRIFTNPRIEGKLVVDKGNNREMMTFAKYFLSEFEFGACKTRKLTDKGKRILVELSSNSKNFDVIFFKEYKSFRFVIPYLFKKSGKLYEYIEELIKKYSVDKNIEIRIYLFIH